jgi:hypothetical protein
MSREFAKNVRLMCGKMAKSGVVPKAGSTTGNRETSTTGGLGLTVPSFGKQLDHRNLPLSACRIQPAGERGASPREPPGQPVRSRREPLAKWQSPDQQSASKASKGVTAPPDFANGRPRNGKVGPVGQEAGWVGPLRKPLPGPTRRCIRPEEFSSGALTRRRCGSEASGHLHGCLGGYHPNQSSGKRQAIQVTPEGSCVCVAAQCNPFCRCATEREKRRQGKVQISKAQVKPTKELRRHRTLPTAGREMAKSIRLAKRRAGWDH